MDMTPSVPSRSDQSELLVDLDAPAPSVFWKAAFGCWLAGMFILYSRFFDEVLVGYSFPRIILSLMALFFLLSGRPLVFFQSMAGKIAIALVFWVSFTLIFSVWKSGSLPQYQLLVESIVIFAIAAGVPITIGNVRKTTYALAISGLMAALLSFPYGADMYGRLCLRQGSYADPNYYAMALVLVVPFFWEMAISAKSYFVKIFAWSCMAPIFWAMMRAGSRGAMLGFGVMLLFLLILSPLKTKVMLVAVTLVGLFTAVAVLPGYLRVRYFTFFDSERAQQVNPGSTNSDTPDPDQLQADVNSAEGRKRLLFTSIALTFEHPLFGVGPGNFPTAVFGESRAKGIVHNEWLVTHNSYTQISSETGFMGVILFVALIVIGFRNVAIVLKGTGPAAERPDANTHRLAKYLLLSLSAMCVCIFFLAVGYESTIYVWVGLTVSLRRAYEERRSVVEVAVGESDEPASAKPAFAPVYAKAKDRMPQRTTQAPRVEGRPVRFNRFR